MTLKPEDTISVTAEDNLYLDPYQMKIKKNFATLKVDTESNKNRKMSDGKMYELIFFFFNRIF